MDLSILGPQQTCHIPNIRKLEAGKKNKNSIMYAHAIDYLFNLPRPRHSYH